MLQFVIHDRENQINDPNLVKKFYPNWQKQDLVSELKYFASNSLAIIRHSFSNLRDLLPDPWCLSSAKTWKK